jgi:endonuclease/exonuclease/phosphatase family metal-dependent hydrolase
MWRNALTAATANQQALARAGADLMGPTMPGRAADLIVPMPDPPPQVMKLAHDRVLGPARMVRDASRVHVAGARMDHQPMVLRAVAAAGAIARTLGLVLIQPQDAMPTVDKAPAQMAPVVDDDPAKTTRDPIDRKLVQEHVQPRNQEVRPAYVGMKDLLREGEAGRG